MKKLFGTHLVYLIVFGDSFWVKYKASGPEGMINEFVLIPFLETKILFEICQFVLFFFKAQVKFQTCPTRNQTHNNKYHDFNPMITQIQNPVLYLHFRTTVFVPVDTLVPMKAFRLKCVRTHTHTHTETYACTHSHPLSAAVGCCCCPR